MSSNMTGSRVTVDPRFGWEWGPDFGPLYQGLIGVRCHDPVRVHSGEQCQACGRAIDTMGCCGCGPEV